MNITESKKHYNHYLERYYNGVKYLDDKKRTEEERENGLNLLDAIMKELNNLLKKVGSYTQGNILGGF